MELALAYLQKKMMKKVRRKDAGAHVLRPARNPMLSAHLRIADDLS